MGGGKEEEVKKAGGGVLFVEYGIRDWVDALSFFKKFLQHDTTFASTA